ncbi:MAG TPA: DUF481 domain-containing protein [Ignavibacteria bacterium]|nr:DUF481 domain-containing protein [Ignavibacteria bacterium]HMR40855.1 DUF481 domain-containing protein [Ignavibacteria bacterium]
MIKYFLFTLVLFIYTDPSIAHDSSKEKDSSETKWSGSITGSGLYQSGNTNKFLIQGRGELKRVNKKLEMILNASGDYGENKGAKDDNSYYGSLTADLFYDNIFSPFVLQYLEYTFGKGIDLRSQTGGGLKYLFVPEDKHKSSVSLALIYDYLKLVEKPGNTQSKEARFSFRLKTKQKLFDDKLIFNFVFLFQPVVDEWSNSNKFLNTTLEIPLTNLFSLNVIYNYTFDNIVSVGRKRADNKLTFGAGLYF